MNGELVSYRDVARAALSWDFDHLVLAKHTSREDVQLALDGYRKAMVPALKLTKGEKQADQKTLAIALRSIGVRIRPDMIGDAARIWLAAMVEALEPLPLRIALVAANEAKAIPMKHPSEVLGIVQDHAKPHLDRYVRAIRNLERLLKEIDQPSPEKTHAKQEPRQVPAAELPASVRESFIRVGILIDGADGPRYATDEEWEARQRAARASRDERPHVRAREDAGR